MRAAVLLIALAACTPDVFSESYLCGPDALCPEGQACNGPDNICVLKGAAQPFSCTPKIATEPDDSAANAHEIANLLCPSLPFSDENCMLQDDAEDWVKLKAPAMCNTNAVSTVKLAAGVSFPIAFERIAIELWDLGTMTKLADDAECTRGEGVVGEEIRCLDYALVAGSSYGIKVRPAGAGDGDCDGNCRFNRYTLRVELSTP
ncbi:MAG TPA: hypothetical protein VMZ53_30215 [Kofleriaceae bacterium]|nr:hypothetical protein [Kofleriaceae bacterium]